MSAETPDEPDEPADPGDPADPAEDPLAIEIIWRDEHLLAVHKPAGLLVHRSALDAHEHDNLLTRLRRQLQRPLWPLHRLDKGTSGLLLLALDAPTATLMGQAFADGRVHKRYRAVVRGWPAAAGRSDQPLARDPERPSTGQPHLNASTTWRVLQRLQWPLPATGRLAPWPSTRAALLEVAPLTGRRHQIRRHFKQLGHPLIGDATHGKGPLNRAVAAWLGVQRLWLHAEWLQFEHPHGGAPIKLHAAPGEEWQALNRNATIQASDPADTITALHQKATR